MYATDRQTSDRRETKASLNACALWGRKHNKLCVRPPQYGPPVQVLTFDLLTLKVVSESCVTWATSVPILVFLGLSLSLSLELGPMYTTDRRQTQASLNASAQ